MTNDPEYDMGKIIDAFLRLSAANLCIAAKRKELAGEESGDARLARKMERLNGMGRFNAARRAGVQDPACSSSAGFTRHGD
jgi:hypothetical protein